MVPPHAGRQDGQPAEVLRVLEPQVERAQRQRRNRGRESRVGDEDREIEWPDESLAPEAHGSHPDVVSQVRGEEDRGHDRRGDHEPPVPGDFEPQDRAVRYDEEKRARGVQTGVQGRQVTPPEDHGRDKWGAITNQIR